MNVRESVIAAARSLSLLDDKSERLVKIDSLTLIDLVLELEQKIGIEIPSHALRSESFQTVDTVTNLITKLQQP